MKKRLYKIGDIIQRGILPCRYCGVPHDNRVNNIKPLLGSWMMDDKFGNTHPYVQMTAEEIFALPIATFKRLKARAAELLTDTKPGGD